MGQTAFVAFEHTREVGLRTKAALEADFGFKPSTSLREGLRRFAQWYKEFYL